MASAEAIASPEQPGKNRETSFEDETVNNIGSQHVAVEKLAPGVFQVVVVRQENQDRAFVSKPVPIVSEFARVCNEVLEGSFNTVNRKVDFAALSQFQVQPVALFGYNDDVWNSLGEAGMPVQSMDKEAMKEGLILWCPWLRMKDNCNADDESLEGFGILDDGDDCMQDAKIYVAAWAGTEVTEIQMHAPFNLCLRLLMELCDSIVIPVSDAASFDESKKPFQSGEGITEDFAVQEQTSSKTMVEVATSATNHTFSVDYHTWLGRSDTMIPVSTTWQNMPGGSSMLGNFRISSTLQKEAFVSGPPGTEIPDLQSKKLALSEGICSKMKAQTTQLAQKVSECIPTPERRGKVTTVAQFAKVVSSHPAVLLSQVMCPSDVVEDKESLQQLKNELSDLVQDAESNLKDSGKRVTKDAIESDIQNHAQGAGDALMQKWFAVPLPDDETLSNLTGGGSVMDFPEGVPEWQSLIDGKLALETEFEGTISKDQALQEIALITAYKELLKFNGVAPHTITFHTHCATVRGVYQYTASWSNNRPCVSKMSIELRASQLAAKKAEWRSRLQKPDILELAALLAGRLALGFCQSQQCRPTDCPGLLPRFYECMLNLIGYQKSPSALEDVWACFSVASQKYLHSFMPQMEVCEWLEDSDVQSLDVAFERDIKKLGMHKGAVELEVAASIVLGQHLPNDYLELADPLTVARLGLAEAIKTVDVSLQRSSESYEGSSSSVFGLLSGPMKAWNALRGRASQQPSEEKDQQAPLDADQVEKDCKSHATHILAAARPWLQEFLSSDMGRALAQAAANRLYHQALDKPPTQKRFNLSWGVIRFNLQNQARSEILAAVGTLQERLRISLDRVVKKVVTHCLGSSGGTSGSDWIITDVSQQAFSSPRVRVAYKYERKVDSFGSWVANGLLKSARGEADERALSFKVLHHEEHQTHVTLLNAEVGESSRNIIQVRHLPGSHIPTFVYVLPPDGKVSERYRVLRYDKAVLAARYEPSTRVLAMLVSSSPTTSSSCAASTSQVLYSIVFCALSPDYSKMQQAEPLPVDQSLTEDISRQLAGGQGFVIDPPFVLLPAAKNADGSGGANKMALIMEADQIRLYNILTKSWEPEKLDTDTTGKHVETIGKQWMVTPCRTALLAVHHSISGWVADAYALESAGTVQPLFTQILHEEDLPDEVSSLPEEGPRFTAARVEDQAFLLAINGTDTYATPLQLQSINVENALSSAGAPAPLSERLLPGNRLLNYVHSCCLRFPLDNSIGLVVAESTRLAGQPQDCRVVNLILLNKDPAVAQGMASYTRALINHALRDMSHKPFGTTVQLNTASLTTLTDAPVTPTSTSEDSKFKPLGDWIRTAMTLVPLQLSRCSANSLEPMHDGEPRREFVEDDDIISMSKRLQLGLYESILGGHMGPVKIVCALGQQSVGKSFHLNHLGGVFFDVAGGRCTDGVWMSTRVVRDPKGAETLIVFLDCEGIGSPEREETEDMLHCLLVGAVSSLTMFKTHFAFGKELIETLKRLNKGAQKVEDIGGKSVGTSSKDNSATAKSDRMIFRGSIMFCLKDTPADANEKRGIIKDFKGPLNRMVKAGDNFVTAIYNNKVSISAFPGISPAFYTTLEKECVSKLQAAACPVYRDGPQALYMLKLMLIKMAHKDWTAIDRQWIASQAKQVRNYMHAVTHFGCEGSISEKGNVQGATPLTLPTSVEGNDQESLNRESVTFTLNIAAEVLASVQKLLEGAMKQEGCRVSMQLPTSCSQAAILDSASAFPSMGGLASNAGYGESSLGLSSNPFSVHHDAAASPAPFGGLPGVGDGLVQLPADGLGWGSKGRPGAAGAVGEAVERDGQDSDQVSDDEMLSVGAVEELEAMNQADSGSEGAGNGTLWLRPTQDTEMSLEHHAVDHLCEPSAHLNDQELPPGGKTWPTSALISPLPALNLLNGDVTEGMANLQLNKSMYGTQDKGATALSNTSFGDSKTKRSAESAAAIAAATASTGLRRRSPNGTKGAATGLKQPYMDLPSDTEAPVTGLKMPYTDPAGISESGGMVQLQFTIQMPDSESRLGFLQAAEDGLLVVSEAAVEEDVRGLRSTLIDELGLDQSDKDPNQFRLLQATLVNLITALVKRREAASLSWFQASVASFKDAPEAIELKNSLDVYLRRLEYAWQPCTVSCCMCHLPCTAIGMHDAHDCGTDHRCHTVCDFCAAENPHDEPHACKGKAGHGGKHMCADKPHACGKPCALIGKAMNCNGTCAKIPGHEEDCDCECGNHLCGALCSLPGCTKRCIAPYGSDHAKHDCGVDSCPQKCPLCGQGCPEGHFHALVDPSSHHLCGQEHQCQHKVDECWVPQKCAHPGACVIEGDIDVIKKQFQGKRAQFEYNFITKQDMKRQVCTVKIPPGKLAHDGMHSCGRPAEQHMCGEACPQCMYRCKKRVGHPGRHKSPHGNLGNKKLRASHAEFDLNERQYADGDSAAAETCDSFCSRCGRGHVHPVDCNGTLCKSTLHDHVRHATDRDHCTRKPMDEMTHEYYWEHVNFEDPVKDHHERLEFCMCGNYCGCDEHLNEDGTFEKVHCLLKLWHQPLDQHADPAAHIPEDAEVDHAFIASNGCLFPCRHVTAADVHTMLVIDRSGSMGSTYIFPDNKDIRSHPQFTSELNNVLGVVYEAAYKYLLERSAKAPQDVISFLPFDTSTRVDFLEHPISNVQHLLSKMLNVLPGAGTNFGQALTTMHNTLQQWRASAVRRHKPVVILLTDSEDWYKASSTDVLRRIMQAEQNLPEAERLTVHVIGFGPGVDENFIRDLANIGNGSHLTLQAAKDVDRLCLVKAFTRIAAQPALKVSLQD